MPLSNSRHLPARRAEVFFIAPRRPKGLFWQPNSKLLGYYDAVDISAVSVYKSQQKLHLTNLSKEGDNMRDFIDCEKKLGVEFKNKELLKNAFTHRSYVNEVKGLNTRHNERLEFLGDAVLELIVREYLYTAFPEKPEGELAAIRNTLVGMEILSGVTRRLEVSEFLLTSNGAIKEGERALRTILGRLYEAIVGAIYLDQGYETAQNLVYETLLPELKTAINFRDAKSFFQEVAQALMKITPHYELLKEEGLDNKKCFVVAACLGEEQVATGVGTSKKEAETRAAEAALKVKGWLNKIPVV